MLFNNISIIWWRSVLSVEKPVALLKNHRPAQYPDSHSASLCSRSSQRSSKYQFYNLWYDTTAAQTHDLPHMRQAC